MPLLLKVFHVQNDFLRIPSSFFFETELFHYLDFITTEIRNILFLWVYIFRSRSKALIPRVTWYFLIDTLHMKKKIKSKQKRKYLNTQHAAILKGSFFYQSIYSRQIRTYHHSIWNIVQIGDSNNIVNNLR